MKKKHKQYVTYQKTSYPKKALSSTAPILFLTILFMLAFFLIFFKLLSVRSLHTAEQDHLIMAKFRSVDLFNVYLRADAHPGIHFIDFIDEAYNTPLLWQELENKTKPFFGQRCFRLTINDKIIEQGSCEMIKFSTVIPSRYTPEKPLVITLEVSADEI